MGYHPGVQKNQQLFQTQTLLGALRDATGLRSILCPWSGERYAVTT